MEQPAQVTGRALGLQNCATYPQTFFSRLTWAAAKCDFSIHNVILNVIPGLQSSVLNVLPLPLSRSNVLGKPATQHAQTRWKVLLQTTALIQYNRQVIKYHCQQQLPQGYNDLKGILWWSQQIQ